MTNFEKYKQDLTVEEYVDSLAGWLCGYGLDDSGNCSDCPAKAR
jgi:hypothetical protein